METTRLIEQILDRMPLASQAEVFRMAMLVCQATPDLSDLEDTDVFDGRVRDISMQLSGHEDQHSAIAFELDSLACTEPCQFNVQHLWTLIRAIKVQSQLLSFYLGPESVSLESVPPR
jgi:hypothetical protein